MMATDVPDAHSLKSWQEAFQYPIPTVRRIEQELRRDIVSNREKLRSLVGVRYRDLLDTAQTIMEMNEEMKQVELNLSGVGRHCNPATISRKADGLHRLQEDNMGKVSADRTFAAQLTLLSNCASAISKLLRKRGSSIVVAKLLVVTRLLLSSLSQSPRAKEYVDSLRNQLARLRRTLLTRVEARLASLASSSQDIVESLSAFCLATSSSAEDAFRYFHEVRVKAIDQRIRHTGTLRHNLLEALNLYIHTLRQTADILSGRLFDALKSLTAHPLLDDPAIQRIGELGIDILQPWISKEIRTFTPWIKHDQISKQGADKVIKFWSKQAFATLVARAKEVLVGCEEFQEALAIRNHLLEAWLPVLNSIPCYSSMDVLEGIRNLVNDQLVSILQEQVNGLNRVGVETSSIMAKWSDMSAQAALSLWDPELVFLDFSDGAVSFKRELTRRTQGQDAHVLQILDIYGNWLTATTSRFGMIQDLRNARWEDILEDDIDEELLETVTGLLKDDDPHLLQTEHADTLRNGFQSLQLSLNEAVEGMGGQHRGQQAAFLLRIVRAIRGSIPNEVLRNNYVSAENIVSTLHRILAEEIVRQVSLPTLTKSLNRRRQRCAGRTLWEGDPQLPVQPSQPAFKLLRKLVLVMEQQGPDLWNSTAVNELKYRLISQTSSNIRQCLEKCPLSPQPEKDAVSGEQEDEKDEENAQKDRESDTARDHRMQLLFDILYLGFALALEQSVPEDPLEPLIDTVKDGLGLNEQSIDFLKARSQEYWKRTQLLFGLLD